MAVNVSDTLRFLPVGLDVRDKVCMIVGGGGVGTRKAQTLTRAGAHVTIISPSVTAELAELIQDGRIHWVNDSFCEGHLRGAYFVIAATDDEDLNARIVRLADSHGALVCDASSAERSQLIFGALLQDDDVTVAVFTGGRDPARARRTRDLIADLLASDRRPE